jgi:hypothetical protein
MLFENNAMDLVTDLIPKPAPEEMNDVLRAPFPTVWRVSRRTNTAIAFV